MTGVIALWQHPPLHQAILHLRTPSRYRGWLAALKPETRLCASHCLSFDTSNIWLLLVYSHLIMSRLKQTMLHVVLWLGAALRGSGLKPLSSNSLKWEHWKKKCLVSWILSIYGTVEDHDLLLNVYQQKCTSWCEFLFVVTPLSGMFQRYFAEGRWKPIQVFCLQ